MTARLVILDAGECGHQHIERELDRTLNMRPGDHETASPSLYIVTCRDCGNLLDIAPVELSRSRAAELE